MRGALAGETSGRCTVDPGAFAPRLSEMHRLVTRHPISSATISRFEPVGYGDGDPRA
jgi:hypothetical protein